MSAGAPPPEGTGGGFADPYGPPPGGQQQQADAPELIGGFHPHPQRFRTDHPGGRIMDVELSPNAYFEGDEVRILRALTTEDRVRLQQQLVALGLASGNVAFGEIDRATENAMTQLLEMSNRAGTQWQDTLNRIATRPEMQDQLRGADGAEFKEQAYLAPDYATLAQRVKGMFRDQLGRDPEEDELAQFTAELQGWDKQSFDAQQRQEAVGTDELGQPVNAQGEVIIESGGMATAIDPLSRFAERFEQVYSGELDFLEAKDEAVETQEITDAATGTLSAMSRGQL